MSLLAESIIQAKKELYAMVNIISSGIENTNVLRVPRGREHDESGRVAGREERLYGLYD